MKRKSIICIVLFFASVSIYCQKKVTPEYFFFRTKADSLFKVRDYKASGINYNYAFKTMGNKSLENDRYNAACSWALANYPDSAFIQLFCLTTLFKFSDVDGISNDGDLKGLHSDKRWLTLVENIQSNKKKIEEKYNFRLIFVIDSLKNEDQKWRGLLRKINNNEIDTTVNKKSSAIRNIAKTDSLNYYLVNKIFNEFGFPNYEIVGENSSNNFWLLIQHQDNNVKFQDKVLKQMKREVDKKLASASNYVYLIDRVKLNLGKKQIYGTQMILNAEKTSYEPKPIIKPKSLNARRKKYNLGSIEDYIKTMNLRYYGDLKK